MLAKATALEIVHDEGPHLQAAAHARAAAVSDRQPEARQVPVPAIAPAAPETEPGDRDDGQDPGPETAPPALIGLAGGPAGSPEVKRDAPRRVDPDVVLVELDEGKVPARAHTGRTQVLALTAMVLLAGRCRHLAAPTAQELIDQVGALLAVLGVPQGRRRLLVPADGARRIREWFAALGLADKTMIVCGWHVVKRVPQDLSRACGGREHRRTVETAVLQASWQGRVDAALEVLRPRAGELRAVEVLEDWIGSLEARRADLPDYATRPRAGLRIASNRVERFNDRSVSGRCKHRGTEWTEAGVVSLAVLEATRRNGELPTWGAEHRFPAWRVPRGRKKAA